MRDEVLFPRDLTAWRAFQQRQGPAARRLVRAVKDARRPKASATYELAGDARSATVLIAFDALGPTHRAALADAAHLLTGRVPTAVLGPPGTASALGLREPAALLTLAEATELPWQALAAVVSIGHFLAVGGAAQRIASARDARSYVVQHGLLAPQVPPLAHNVTLFAFSRDDGDYWRAGRQDVAVRVVGSQLLWDASRVPAARVSGPGVFLGQLHGAELPRRQFAAAAESYCGHTGAAYRPHPAETDLLSRATHARWRRGGMPFETSGACLASLTGPVAAVFSTGVVQAAALRRPSWVVHPDPPAWLASMWERYGMSRWRAGRACEPTRAPWVPQRRPADMIAEVIADDIARPLDRTDWGA